MRVLVFVSTVWAIAACFLGLAYGVPLAIDGALTGGWISPSLVLSAARNDCSSVVGVAAVDSAQARIGAFSLGVSVGVSAAQQNAGLGSPAPEARIERASLASALGVPTPEVPGFESYATALSDFIDAVQFDPQCTAAALEKAYSSRHAALYRFGAIAAHSASYRSVNPALGPVFASGVRVYGEESRLPFELWSPLVDDLSGLPDDQVGDAVIQSLARVADFLERAPGEGP